jgi:cobalt-zinc-cadmium efflux system outer membrane protein
MLPDPGHRASRRDAPLLCRHLNRRCLRHLVPSVALFAILTAVAGYAAEQPVAASAVLAPAAAAAPANDAPADGDHVILSLAQAETLLLAQNLAISGARSGVDAAKAAETIASYRPNPALTLSAEQFNVRHPLFHMASADPNSQGYQHFYTVRVDQLLERGGKRGFRMQSAELQTQAAVASLADAIRQQLFQLRQGYFTVVEAKQQLDLAQRMLTVTDQNELIVKAQVASGGAAEADLLTFQVNRLQFQQAMIAAQQTYSQAISDLMNILNYSTMSRVGTMPARSSVLAGVDLNGPELLSLSDALDIAPVTLESATLTTNAETRSDVQSARHAMDAAEAAIKGAQALRQEDLDVGVEYQRNGGDDTVGLAFQINLPAFNNHQGDILQAEAQYQQARFAYQQVRTQAITDITKAFKAYDAARQLIVLYTNDTIAKAGESLRIATGVYQEGGTGLIELFQAQQAYDQTMTGAIQARFAYRVALYQLEMATGAPIPGANRTTP